MEKVVILPRWLGLLFRGDVCSRNLFRVHDLYIKKDK